VGRRSSMVGSGIIGGTGVVFAAGTAIVLALGAFGHRSGALTLGTTVLLFQYTLMVRTPFERLITRLREYQAALAGIARIGALLAERHTLPEPARALVLPVVVIGVLSRLMRNRIWRLHRRARELGAAVTAYIGEIFGAVLALKAAGAEDAALERLRAHNWARRDAAVRDRMATDLLDTTTGTTVEIGIGLVLLLAAPVMCRGDFTVGDLALFTVDLQCGGLVLQSGEETRNGPALV
jgi:ABC-type multidrug transport system fused ATPase/permease subunit